MRMRETTDDMIEDRIKDTAEDKIKGTEENAAENAEENTTENAAENTAENTAGEKYRHAASLTLEASLGLTVFIFLIVCLVMPIKMLDTQRKIQMTLESLTKEMSQYAYIRYRLEEGEDGLESEADDDEAARALVSEAAAEIYAAKKIGDAVGKKIEGLSLTSSRISENGEQIDLRAEYRLKLPFHFFTLKSVPSGVRSFRRGWIGSKGGRRHLGGEDESDAEIMVYVGNSMGRYHWFPDCHYISNNISAVPFGELESQRNSAGKRYKPCSYCGKAVSQGGTAYVLPGGEYYHGRKECSSLAYYVRKVPLSEVEYLGECSYCGRMKGK